MLKIIINGIIADLKGASKQELIIPNPMWDYEKMTGEYGLPFSLPFSPTNDRIFSNARSEFSETIATSYTCEQYFNDDLIAEGLIILTDTNGAYNCNFTSNIRDIFTPVSGSVRYDGYLRDILPAGPSVATVALRNAMTTWNGIVCYPTIFNDQFYSANAPVGWDNYINSYNGTTYQNTTFMPAVSIKYLLTQIGIYFGISIVGDFISDAFTNRMVIFHNAAEDGSTTSNLKIAVGDMKINSFINEIRTIFGLTGEIDLINKKIKLDYARTFFDNEVKINLSEICSNFIKNSADFNGILLSYEKPANDKIITDYPVLDYQTTGISKPKKIKSSLSPLQYFTSPYMYKMSHKGKSTVNGQSAETVSPRIGIYYGLFNGGAGLMPILDLSNNDHLKNYHSPTYGRLFKFFTAEEAFWKNTFEASFKINLRKLNLSTFDIKSKVHINGWNYLIKRIVMDTQNPENSLLEAYRA